MYFGALCRGYALTAILTIEATTQTRLLLMKKKNLFDLFITTANNEIYICSSKYETGLVHLVLI